MARDRFSSGRAGTISVVSVFFGWSMMLLAVLSAAPVEEASSQQSTAAE